MNHNAGAERREAILAAMQDRLDWLREHKDAPLWHWGNELLAVASRSEVNAIAVSAMQMPEERPDSYRVTVQFGAGVSYVARAESARAMVAAGGAA